MPITKESRGFVLSGLAFSLSLIYLGNRTLRRIGMLTAATAGALGWALRDPDRYLIPIKDGVLSPADGQIIRIDSVESRFGPARRLSIFIGPADCHVLRAPVSGAVESGHGTAVFSGTIPAMVEHVGGTGHRFVARETDGDVEQGERIASIQFASPAGPLFGTRVDLTFPVDQRLMVTVGDRVIAGITALSETPA